MPQATLSLLAKIWFLTVAPLVLVDSVFVFTRAKGMDKPHPLAEVVPFKYWTIYAKYDRRYAANDDAFVVVQSWLNLVEVAMGLVVPLLDFFGLGYLSIKLAVMVSLMTLYKTILYFLMDFAEGGTYTRHNTFKDKVTMVIVPSTFWIVVPAIILYQSMRSLAVATVSRHSKSKANRYPDNHQQKQQSNMNAQSKKRN